MAIINDSAYLSMTELARRLDLPESTMRYYCKRFAKFLPYKGEGRRRRYSPETEKTLLFIANAMHRNKNATAVELMLQSGQYVHSLPEQFAQQDILPAEVQPNVLQNQAFFPESGQLLMNIMERQAESLGKIAEALGVIAQGLGQAGVSASPSGPGSSESANTLKEEVATLKQQMFTAEKVHQEDLEQLRKWLGHMGDAIAKLSS